MNQDTQEAQTQTWEESHPWLSQLTDKDDEDTLGEVIRYTLDELRLACTIVKVVIGFIAGREISPPFYFP